MALPKRRHSKARGRKRRTGDSLTPPAFTRCSECGEPIQAHRACAKCGAYKGKRDVIKPAKKAL